MSEFRLSNLGYKFQKNITSMHPNVNKIRWEMLTYNLKEDTITGDLKIDIHPSVVQRCFRDMMTGGLHIFVDRKSFEEHAKNVLGALG